MFNEMKLGKDKFADLAWAKLDLTGDLRSSRSLNL